jgi:hypothetical protein
MGGPWGIEDASCPNRPNPPVPTWRARARNRFQVGLGDDLIGYEKPAWSALYDTPGTFTPTDCVSDPHSHSHALEDESVGPTASNMVAQNLTSLLDQKPDSAAEVRLGRYVKADGTLTDAYSAPQDQGAPGHFPTDAVAIWLAAPGATALDPSPGRPDSGTIVALGSVSSFGGRAVDVHGDFMDFDGAAQPAGPDVTTRGMVVKDVTGAVTKRYYVDVYPALTVQGALGPATDGYPRPKGATPVRVSLVPAYTQCTNPDRQHGPPLAFGSCSRPQQTSSGLTVGTPDANGKVANSQGSVTYNVIAGDPTTPASEADVLVSASIADVRVAGSLGDYAGELGAAHTVQITDRAGGTAADEPNTTQAGLFRYALPCAPTASTATGSACTLSSSFNALVPGSVVEGTRAIWELGDVTVLDGDNRAFERQGIFVP